jgi:hypothetical protein
MKSPQKRNIFCEPESNTSTLLTNPEDGRFTVPGLMVTSCSYWLSRDGMNHHSRDFPVW